MLMQFTEAAGAFENPDHGDSKNLWELEDVEFLLILINFAFMPRDSPYSNNPNYG